MKMTGKRGAVIEYESIDLGSVRFNGEKVKKFMREKGLTQKEMGEMTGFPGATICNSINGHHKVGSAVVLLAMSKVLKVPMEELLIFKVK